MKKLLSFILVLTILVLAVIPIAAEDDPTQKEEVVYGILNLDGSVKNLYVVNIFNSGTIVDYGNYSDIHNMTTSEKINQNGEKITISTNTDKLYYQGTLIDKELPWDTNIKYYLDNKEVSDASLAGKSGKLEISVSVKQNYNIDSSFFNNYALQIGISLDNKLCTNIKADNATVAEAGSKKQLTYTVLPGKSIEFRVTADVHDFEMDAITLNGIKLALGITVDSKEFSDQLDKLSNAIKELDVGAGGLLYGLNELADGMQKYLDGMKAYNTGLSKLSEGVEKLNIGAAGLSNGLSELTKQNTSLVGGALAIQQSAFDSVNAQLKSMGLELPVLTPENYNAVLSPIPNLAEVKKQLDGALQFTQGLRSYTNGVAQLSKGASDLADGTEEFKASSKIIAASSDELYRAGAEINLGIRKLRDGLASYKDGTKKFRNETTGMSSEVDNKIHEMLGSISGKGDKVVSFVSDKNTNISAVQFVLKTEAIKLPEAPKTATAEPLKLSFWQKLLKLFGLYKGSSENV